MKTQFVTPVNEPIGTHAAITVIILSSSDPETRKLRVFLEQLTRAPLLHPVNADIERRPATTETTLGQERTCEQQMYFPDPDSLPPFTL